VQATMKARRGGCAGETRCRWSRARWPSTAPSKCRSLGEVERRCPPRRSRSVRRFDLVFASTTATGAGTGATASALAGVACAFDRRRAQRWDGLPKPICAAGAYDVPGSPPVRPEVPASVPVCTGGSTYAGAMSRTSAQLIVQCLENEGVTHVFGIPGEKTSG
jgi:hypothetical protein